MYIGAVISEDSLINNGLKVSKVQCLVILKCIYIYNICKCETHDDFFGFKSVAQIVVIKHFNLRKKNIYIYMYYSLQAKI